ncbi:MAG: cell division ATP-binding protein FtsE [Desulfohalobiaceae bacterium]
MLQVKHLSYAFSRHWVLKDISFDVSQGEFVYLTGPSGAGKTTLLRILHGALPLQRGQAEVADIQLKGIKSRHLPRLRRVVSVVFQDFKVLGARTVCQNIALPLDVQGFSGAQKKRRVNAVLRALDLGSKSEIKCRELSGGEQQRVAIARAVVTNPKVLLADEPTGNLDEDLSLRLLKILQHFNQHGTTVLLATHNKMLLQALSGVRILALDQGRLSCTQNQAQQP